jgi:hypothetical protein
LLIVLILAGVLAPFHPHWSLLKFPSGPFCLGILSALIQSAKGDIIYFDMIPALWGATNGPAMQIVSHCQQRALFFLQIAKECPAFREQAFYMAREWLDVAAVRIICLAQIEGIEKEDRAD